MYSQSQATLDRYGRRCLLLVWVCVATVSLLQGVATPAIAAEADLRIVRIGTGGTGGTYFPIGSLIAQALSGNRRSERGGSEPPPDELLLVAQISNGSVNNIRELRKGTLDAALVQADVAHWAHQGSVVFSGEPRYERLRAVAHLYPESLHLVVRKGSGIVSVADLRGRRVSLDEPGSGTVLDARIILDHYEIKESDMDAVYLKPYFAVQEMAQNQLDAFFIIAGYPVTAVLELTASTGAHLVPIEGAPIDTILQAHPYFERGVIPAGTYDRGVIPAGTYKGVSDTPTLNVGAQLVVDGHLDEALVYRLTQALWSERTLRILKQGHPKGGEIRPERAIDGISIPLHPGAERYYRESGLLPDTAVKD